MGVIRLNVAIDRPKGSISVALDESGDLADLLSELRTRWVGNYGKQNAPDPWIRYHKLMAPPGIAWLKSSNIQDLVRDLDRSACTTLPEDDLLSTWFQPSSIDKKHIHILLVRKVPLSELADVFHDYNLPYTSALVTMHVARLRAWSEADVTDTRNKIQLLWLRDDPVKRAPLDETRRKLDRTRSISDSELLQSSQYETVRNASVSPPVFETSTAGAQDDLVSRDEFESFACLSTTYVRWVANVLKKSSNLKEGWFRTFLVAPPMFELEDTQSLDHHYEFNSGVSWKFSLLIKPDNQPHRRYSPAPDFLLAPVSRNSSQLHEGFWPVLLGEVISDKMESDRWRMLLQLAGCARINGVVTPESQYFVVQGVYVNGQCEVERYLAFANVESNSTDPGQLPTVYIVRDIFDIKALSGAVKFLRSMYNFVGLVRDVDHEFDPKYAALCTELQGPLGELPALSSRSAGIKSQPTPVSQHGTPREETIPEETAMAMGYENSSTSRTHPHIAYAWVSKQEHVLKRVIVADELLVLKELNCASAIDNHIIPIHQFFPTDHGTVISMPAYPPLNTCGKLSVPVAVELCQQLLIALRYMHSHNIVHRDLKPENVVVDLRANSASRLFVIDFSLAAFVKGRDDYFSGGPVGTEGFTAPEVGFGNKYRKEFTYSPIEADLWAAGRLVAHMLLRSGDFNALELKTLWEISELLMHNDPTRRPSAEDALARLSAEATQHHQSQPHTARLTNDSHAFAASNTLVVH